MYESKSVFGGGRCALFIGINQKIITISVFMFVGMLIEIAKNYRAVGIDLYNPLTIIIGLSVAMLTTVMVVIVSPIPWDKTIGLNNLVRILISVIASVFVIVIFVFITLGLAKQLPGKTLPFLHVLRADISAYALPLLGIGYLISSWKRAEKEKQLAASEVEAARISLLYSHLTPHTLFNALNTVANLIHESVKCDSDAERSVMALSQYFQNVLNSTRVKKAPLRTERETIANFLKFESYRWKQKLQVEWNWDYSLDDLEMPPLLFQPMVENAIKHGISECESGGILRVVAEKTHNGIRLAVENTGAPLSATQTELNRIEKNSLGLGTSTLKSRLNFTYGKNAVFNLEERNGVTVAEVLLNKDAIKMRNSDLTPIPMT